MGSMSSASNLKAKPPTLKKLKLVFSFSMLLILLACNYPGRSENLIAATATMAAARQTAAAMLYPSPGPNGTPVIPQPTPIIPDVSTPKTPTYVIPTSLPIKTSTPTSPYTGQVPAGMMLSQLLFTLLSATPIILPLALMLGIMLAVGRLYRDSEMPVLHAAGAGPKRFLRPLTYVVLPILLIKKPTPFPYK